MLKENLTNKTGSPLFIMGSGRSGTTLLQRTLNSHKDICIWGEHGGFLKQTAEAYFSFLDGDFKNKAVIPGKDDARMENSLKRIKNPANWIAWDNCFDKDGIKNNFRYFLESFFNPQGLNNKFWGFKEIRYGLEDRVLEFLKDIFPEAKFIFMVRNPSDTILSQIAMFCDGDKENFQSLAKNWVMQNNAYFDFNKNNPESSIIIRYEDCVSDNEKALNKMFSFLDLQCSPRQSEVIFFDSGRGEDPKPCKRQSLLNKEEMNLVFSIVRETALKFNYQ